MHWLVKALILTKLMLQKGTTTTQTSKQTNKQTNTSKLTADMIGETCKEHNETTCTAHDQLYTLLFTLYNELRVLAVLIQ